MSYKKMVSCLGGILAIGLSLRAQNDIQLSQHMFDRLHYNPAVTGASHYVNVSAFMRDQWVGWEGAPNVRMLTAHSYFDRLRSGFGLVLMRDEIGFEQSYNAKFTYAYHLPLTRRSYLSLGIGGGVQYRSFDRSRMQAAVPDDNWALSELGKKTVADFDFGIEYNCPRFTAGFSVTHLTHSSSEKTSLISGRHYYGFLRYTFPLAFRWELEPSLFTQANERFIHSEVGALIYYDRRFWAGGSFRADRELRSESFVVLAGISFSSYFRLGYSYDVYLGNLGNYSDGAHELLLVIRIPKRKGRYAKSPRFFE